MDALLVLAGVSSMLVYSLLNNVVAVDFFPVAGNFFLVQRTYFDRDSISMVFNVALLSICLIASMVEAH